MLIDLEQFKQVNDTFGHHANVSEILTRLGDLVECPVAISGVRATVGCSVGISWCPFDGVDATALLRSTDVAMYRVKKQRDRLQLKLKEAGAARPRGAGGDNTGALNVEKSLL